MLAAVVGLGAGAGLVDAVLALVGLVAEAFVAGLEAAEPDADAFAAAGLAAAVLAAAGLVAGLAAALVAVFGAVALAAVAAGLDAAALAVVPDLAAAPDFAGAGLVVFAVVAVDLAAGLDGVDFAGLLAICRRPLGVVVADPEPAHRRR